jgi:hypothetical protein
MPFSDRVHQLDREIAATFERTVSDLRRELTERLRSGTSEILRRIEELTPELPPRFLSHDQIAPVAEEAAAAATVAARQDALVALRDALAVIDTARSQTEILNALLAETGRFASRGAVLLLRGAELRGWGARGFADTDAVRALALSAAGDGAWGRFAAGQGAVRLSGADCADLCSRLESPLPQEGALIPIVLRDRVVAGFYADRTDGGELQVEALQSLAYAAAQAIELLPLRERAATVTLRLLDASAQDGAAAPSPVPQAAPPAAPQAPAPPTPTPPAPPAPPAPVEAAKEAVKPVEDTPEIAAEEAGWTVETIEETDEVPAPPEMVAEPDFADTTGLSPEAYTVEPVDEPALGRTYEMPLPPVGGGETVLLPRPGREPLAAAPAPTAPAAPAPEPPPAAERTPLRSVPAAGFGTPPAEDDRPPASPEVRPPSGIQGPGWAFATTRVPVAPDEEALHEEARRLARLLVSEVKLYNEEHVEEGRRNRDICERLKDDIDRSRQMYEERVDPVVLRSTDYFYQELVRILAAGDPKALGI